MDPRGSSAPTPGQYTCILPSYSNIFSSETAWQIKAKFYVKHLWNGGINVQATFAISKSKGMEKTLRIFRSSRSANRDQKAQFSHFPGLSGSSFVFHHVYSIDSDFKHTFPTKDMSKRFLTIPVMKDIKSA